MTQKLCAIMHYNALFLRLYIIEQINQIIQNKPNKTYAQICLDKLCTFLHYWAILCVKKPWPIHKICIILGPLNSCSDCMSSKNIFISRELLLDNESILRTRLMYLGRVPIPLLLRLFDQQHARHLDMPPCHVTPSSTDSTVRSSIRECSQLQQRIGGWRCAWRLVSS